MNNIARFNAVADMVGHLSRNIGSREYKSAFRKLKNLACKLTAEEWWDINDYATWVWANATAWEFDECIERRYA